MRTVRNSSRLLSGGGLHTPPEQEALPRSRHPLEQAPPQSRHPSWSRQPPPQKQTPQSRHPPPCCKACWDTTCNAYWDSTPPPNRITDTCKNITFATSLRTVIKLFRNKGQIRILNRKNSDLDWYYSRHYQKLKFFIHDLLFCHQQEHSQ